MKPYSIRIEIHLKGVLPISSHINGRVYSYLRTPHMVLLVLSLAVTFGICFVSMIHEPSQFGSLHSSWLLYDLPWFVLSLFGWISVAQSLHYRLTDVRLTFDVNDTSCFVDGGPFQDWWQIHKNSPRSMKKWRVLWLLLILMIIGFSVIDTLNLYHAVISPASRLSEVSKITAVQGLCVAFLLLGLVVSLCSFWNYPYLMALRQNGRWLTIQCKDVGNLPI